MLATTWNPVARYSRQADWGYIGKCVEAAHPLPLVGNGDIFSFTDYKEHMDANPRLATTMIARGAIIKPWLFTEVNAPVPPSFPSPPVH